MGDRQVLLQKRDRGQEAAALQPIAVEILWGDVGGCDQRDAPPEQSLNQPGQDHGVTDVTHEKLIETQHYRLVCDVLRNHLKRVFGAAIAGECSVDTLHKPVKMHPKLALNRQTVEKRIDEVCLTSANPSPKVETALWPLDLPKSRWVRLQMVCCRATLANSRACRSSSCSMTLA